VAECGPDSSADIAPFASFRHDSTRASWASVGNILADSFSRIVQTRLRMDARIPTHGVLFEASRFWVLHRRRDYGPFDYEWSQDFAGVELMYAGRKFGEYCSKDEIFADLKEFRLPAAVVDVATIVLGCLIFGVLNGLPESERRQFICDRLVAGGYRRFAQLSTRPEPPLIDRQPRREA
jgi:hypothetical protein